MAEVSQQIFLGTDQLFGFYDNKWVGINSYEQAVLGPQFTIRTDAYSGSVQLAVPGNLFSAAPISMAQYYSDISAEVRGNGTNLVAAPTGSATEFKSDTPTNFASDGYTNSLFTQDAGCWGQVSATRFAIGTQQWVTEGYFYFTENWNLPPFWHSVVRQREGVNDDWYCDIGNGTGGTNVRMRFIINGSQYFTANFTAALNTWTHVAWVRAAAGVLYGYHNGTRRSAGTDGGNITSTGLVRIIGGASAANDGEAAAHQDLRITIGTDRGYNTATITPPSSIVQKNY
jgi:hypothetical protein